MMDLILSEKEGVRVGEFEVCLFSGGLQEHREHIVRPVTVEITAPRGRMVLFGSRYGDYTEEQAQAIRAFMEQHR